MLLSAVLPVNVSAQVREISPEEYIATFSPLAVQHQKLYGIPASIKMAQAMLESQYGNSELSRKSNNHFGIKCKTEWTGDRVYHDDDEKDDCFRKYDTIEESFIDHSKFLRERPYYQDLFKLDVTDYKGWARGLKKAGYATADHYAESLIKLIDKYELYLLDEETYPAYVSGINPVTFLGLTAASDPRLIDIDNYTVSVFRVGDHGIFLHNGVRYVVAQPGETYESLARNIGIPAKRLMRFNGDRTGTALSPGRMVFIERGGRKS